MFSSEFISQSLQLSSLPPFEASRIWTDTRSLQRGDLFAAIRGDRFDGHDFLERAEERGAVAALIANDYNLRDNLQNLTLIRVPNVTEALRKLAADHRRRLRIPFVAVAGSNGKTTTKEWIAYLLTLCEGADAVFKTARSENSILGIALNLLQITDERFAVMEIGIDEPGWMEKHLDVVQPTVGVVTSIGEEHMERMKTLERVVEEELKLVDYLCKNNGTLAANNDCPYVSKARWPAASLSYGLDGNAQIEGKFLSPRTLHAFGISFQNPLPGKHNAQNLLAALAILRILKPELSLEQLQNLRSGIPHFSGEAHRSRWLQREPDIHLFDDCYNANPVSMEKALQTFLELSEGLNQKIVLGDMLDLGDATAKAHLRILNVAQVLGFDQIFLFGPHFMKALDELPTKSVRMKAFLQYEDLEAELKAGLKGGDAFFIKGSRGMALQRLIPALGFEE